MAGSKNRKGPSIPGPKYYIKGRQVKPVQVHQKKITSSGYKMLRSASFVDTGDLVKNSQGRAMPWSVINFD
jgi:hypothetical protein|tara:strand:- start:345 stop:557 length:213 start_codon:yes stop_codon:yes gene_type:complete